MLESKFNPYKIGEIRPNQLITTFGSGSILDAVKDSVTVLDTPYWTAKGNKIYDSRLASYFGVHYFLPPRASYDNDLPVISFPSYHVCSKENCNCLFDIQNSIDYDTYVKQGPTCPDCGWKAFPARFVIACRDGHLDDFPWRWWVHKGPTTCKGKMKIYSTGETSTLAEMVVECACGKKRSMSGATDKENFKDYKCSGRHPHRPNSVPDKCNCKEIFPSQRGATNIYFPVLRSAISIPPWTNPLYLLLDEHYTRICEYRSDFGNDGVTKVFEKYFVHRFTRAEFEKALENREKKIKEFVEIKEMEYAAFTHHADPTYKKDVKYFKAFEDPVPSYLQKYFSRIIKIERLREVMVLQGFMRIDPPEPEVDNLSKMVPITKNKSDPWLPGVEIHGEGIFIEFNKETTKKWIDNLSVKKRSEEYKKKYSDFVKGKGWNNARERNGEYVLLHTFAHLIIKEMGLQSGYSSASIRERIYSSETMYGVLFYTGSSDKEGSLGGLVELGEDTKFKKILKNALENSLLCTTDPECSNTEIDPDTLNGPACHSCCMISETACENGNRLLDRSFIAPLDGKQECSFFSELIGELCEVSL
jgi:hypothetical protein